MYEENSKHPSQKHYRKPVVQHQDYSTETKWNQTEPCRRSKEKLAIFMVFLLVQRRAPTRHGDNEWGKEPTVPKATAAATYETNAKNYQWLLLWGTMTSLPNRLVVQDKIYLKPAQKTQNVFYRSRVHYYKNEKGKMTWHVQNRKMLSSKKHISWKNYAGISKSDIGVLLIRFTLSERVGTPEQKWANNNAADNFFSLRCRQRLNFVFRVLIFALLVSYKSYATLCNIS